MLSSPDTGPASSQSRARQARVRLSRRTWWGHRPFTTVVATTVLVLLGSVAANVAPVPASADMVVNGCTIVSNPTPTHHTNCPGADMSGANLSGVDLSYANFATRRL